MRPSFFFSCPGLLAALLLCAGGARAELISFGYSWGGTPSTPASAAAAGSVALSLAADGSASAVGGGSPTFIPGATFVTTSTATDSAPDTFDVKYGLSLHLTDTESGEFADLTFSGTLSGSLTATGSTLLAVFDNPLTRTAVLGAHAYTVTISPIFFDVPGPGGTPVQIGALVKADGNPGPVPQQTPEPSSLLLAGLALPMVGAAWRRRRVARDRS
jgi:hypothetical protein